MIPARSQTFAEIDQEIVSKAILLPSADSRSYKLEVLVKRLVKLAQEKRVVRWTDRPNMTIAVDWDVKHLNKQTTSKGQLGPIFKYEKGSESMIVTPESFIVPNNANIVTI